MNDAYIIYIRNTFVFFQTNQSVQRTLDDTMVNDRIDQVFVQLIYSLGIARIELVRLLKNSLVRNYSQESYIQILRSLYEEDCR